MKTYIRRGLRKGRGRRGGKKEKLGDGGIEIESGGRGGGARVEYFNERGIKKRPKKKQKR